MRNKLGKSYEYNVICDVCGFKKKNYQVRRRWDGVMACDEDWETRNILDFYNTKNDTHLLPFVRSDNQTNLSWVPVFTGLTQTPGTGTITITGSYTRSATQVNFIVEIFITGVATTSATGATVTLPVACVTLGSARTMDSQAVFLGGSTIPVGAVANVANWTTSNRSIKISGTYGV